ncbi:hypothetical protein CCAX7_52790 [Capsulimonas corticalis]|uniref:Uncharacterized protein n=1 Tax=Capsulimonas corticalis TaxID=2219043 RepID=A0A402CP20_9BACT|nr:hypothetical protein [Capsulimonas corticalis]BDI33228.1 hypothetical protein CCAX7_52790 [Capsulimonas corticalis]
MRFKSVLSPQEHGALILSDDGSFQIEPSEPLRDKMAELEEAALRRSQTLGIGLGSGLLLLGLALIGLGWAFGRIFGKIGFTLSRPRPVQDVEITRNESGGVQLQLKGIESKMQTIQMSWNVDEVLAPEVDKFLEKYEELRSGA